MGKYKDLNTNTWHGEEKIGVWEYNDYRCCYLTIQRLSNGKYKPMLGASGNLDMPSAPLPPSGYHELNTLEEAKRFLFDYVDYIRDVWDKKVKDNLHDYLSRVNPKQFFYEQER